MLISASAIDILVEPGDLESLQTKFGACWKDEEGGRKLDVKTRG